MSQDVLRYDLMVQEALKGVVRKILTEAGRDGLPGDHHFYVTFRTTAPGVRLSQRLREKHPEEMTIVLQHQFWDLSVGEHAFEVGLSFSGVPERLLVPFDAISTFFDPSVQFGLKFEMQESQDSGSANDQTATPAKSPRGAGSEPAIAPAAPIALPAKIVPAGVSALKGKSQDGKTQDAKTQDAKTQDAKTQGAAESTGKAAGKSAAKPAESAEGEDGGGAQVVSLDSFRKKT